MKQQIKKIGMQFGVAVSLIWLVGCASTGDNKTAELIPNSLQTAAGESLSLKLSATGVQIYECKVSKDNAHYEWVFKAPEAELYSANGAKVGKHYGGPTWEAADGSKVVGEVKAKASGPDTNAIPWLLLAAKSNSGSGMMEHVKSIQRVDTIGGKAPDSGCDASKVGKEARIGYKAIYNFYRSKA